MVVGHRLTAHRRPDLTALLVACRGTAQTGLRRPLDGEGWLRATRQATSRKWMSAGGGSRLGVVDGRVGVTHGHRRTALRAGDSRPPTVIAPGQTLAPAARGTTLPSKAASSLPGGQWSFRCIRILSPHVAIGGLSGGGATFRLALTPSPKELIENSVHTSRRVVLDLRKQSGR